MVLTYMTFGQFRPWLDCDRHCSFCYIDHNRSRLDNSGKTSALMKLAATISHTTKMCDTVGIIGGELFASDDFFHEWACVAESVRNADHIDRFFIGTHLMGDVDFLLDFCDMTGKDVQICTSYDSQGRFFGNDHDVWYANIKKVQDAGYKVVCSATLTDALMHDEPKYPDGVEFKLQPIFYTEEWLEEIAGWCKDFSEYNANLNLRMHDTLPKRKDTLRWFANHKEIAKEYAEYDGKHANLLWNYDRDENEYIASGFVCSNYRSECGHPMIARCYADSDRCTMCDAREVSQ